MSSQTATATSAPHIYNPTGFPDTQPELSEQEKSEILSTLPSSAVWFSHPKTRDIDPFSPPELPSSTISKPFQPQITITTANTFAPSLPKDDLLHPPQSIDPEGTIVPKFQSRTFDFRKLEPVGQYLLAQGENSEGLLLIIIEGWEAWLGTELEKILPGFPTSVFSQWDNERAVLPSFETANNFSCIMDHVETWPLGGVQSTGSGLLGTHEARRLPLATWCRMKGASRTTGNTEKTYSPFIVLVCEPGQNIPQRVKRFYQSDSSGRHWKRLDACAFWIYLDLLSIFTNWDNTWEAARRNLHSRSEALYQNDHASPVLLQTQQLHKDTATTIDLRESMRLQSFSVKHFLDSIKENRTGLTSRSLLVSRLQNILLRLDYYNLTSQTLLEQQQNLLGLIFNTETVSQTQAVNRITILGFIFLPLSFVASIFGITTFTTPARWYPVAAVPVMVFTIFIAGAMSWIIPWWQNRRQQRRNDHKKWWHSRKLRWHSGSRKSVNVERGDERGGAVDNTQQEQNEHVHVTVDDW